MIGFYVWSVNLEKIVLNPNVLQLNSTPQKNVSVGARPGLINEGFFGRRCCLDRDTVHMDVKGPEIPKALSLNGSTLSGSQSDLMDKGLMQKNISLFFIGLT